MPRSARHTNPGLVYHLISRFVDREWYITKESERRHYLDLLGHALKSSDWRCLSYAVMSNHIHLASVAGTQRLASWIRRVHSPFADSMNRAYDRIGPMFVRGPKGLAVSSSGVGNVIAYIHNNPVRAGVVSAPSESTWTSHRAYVGLERPPKWLHVDEGLALSGLGFGDSFDTWVRDPAREESDALIAHLVSGEDASESSSVARDPDRPDARAVVVATSNEVGISLERLSSRRRGSLELLGRSVAARCAADLGFTGAEIAAALGMSQQAISAMRHRPHDPQIAELTARVLQRLCEGQAPSVPIGRSGA